MIDLTDTRMEVVRKLLSEGPDSAVQSLADLLAGDASSDDAICVIRDLVGREAADRQLRNLLLAPLAPLFTPPGDVARLSFPAQTPILLWRALKPHAPDRVAEALGPDRAVSGVSTGVLDELCRLCAEGLRTRTEGFGLVAERLASHAADLERLAVLLDLAPLLRDAIPRLSSWLFNLGGEHDAAIRVTFKRAAAQGGDAGALFMETLFAHLDQPSQILRLICVVMDRPTDRYVASTELASLGERLLDDIDARLERLRRFDPRRGLEAGVAAASAAAGACQQICEFERQITLGKEGVWGARIAGQRRALVATMEMRLREAEPAVVAALPVQSIRLGAKRLRGPPNVGSPPDRSAVDRAMAVITLLDGCRSCSANGGFGALRAKVAETLDGWIDGYVQELMELLHKGDPNAVHIRAYLDVAAELIGLVRDPKAADLVRRRVKAA